MAFLGILYLERKCMVVMFNNEDFADYVVGISLLYQRGEICISRSQLLDCLNFYYVRYCHDRHLQVQPFDPIRSVDKMYLRK